MSERVIGIDASRALIGERTGTENYTAELLAAIARISPPDDIELYLNARRAPKEMASAGVPVCIPFPRLWSHVRLSIEMERRRPGVLFVPAHVVPLVHPRTVVTIHDLGYRLEPSTHPSSQRRMLELSTRWSTRVASRIIAVSETTHDDIVQQYQIDPERISVIHHGVSDRFGDIPPAEIARVRKALGLPDAFVLAVGTIHPRKNLPALAEAVARLAADGFPHELVIAGKRGWMADKVESAIGETGAPVRWLGYVAPGDLPGLYAAADLLCMPSRYEGFGMPVLEAMATGTPVVVANRGALPEIAGDAALVVDPDDAEELASAIALILGDEQVAATLRSRGQSRAAQFTWDRAAEETLALLREVRDGH